VSYTELRRKHTGTSRLWEMESIIKGTYIGFGKSPRNQFVERTSMLKDRTKMKLENKEVI
jgi:hypothetical protein